MCQQLRLPPFCEDAQRWAPQAATPRAKASTLLRFGDPLSPAGWVEAAGTGAITGSCEGGNPAEERRWKDAGTVLLATE